RYLMPLYALFIVLGLLLFDQLNIRQSRLLLGLVLIGQLSGHFWTYPLPISQGWDATLGHLPYYPLRADFLDYFEKQGSENSPLTTSARSTKADFNLELRGSNQAFVDWNDAPVQTEYLWLSNVNKQLRHYYVHHRQDWEVIKERKVLNVYM